MAEYIRDDIYYCKGCGQFFDLVTDKLIEVPYSEMPADFALRVMNDRQQPFKPCHTRRRGKAKKTAKGFDKTNN